VAGAAEREEITRNASSALELWPWRHASWVFARAISFGKAWMRTSFSGRTARITDCGTTAMPQPAATQATMA
jgi:hypothetical protein